MRGDLRAPRHTNTECGEVLSWIHFGAGMSMRFDIPFAKRSSTPARPGLSAPMTSHRSVQQRRRSKTARGRSMKHRGIEHDPNGSFAFVETGSFSTWFAPLPVLYW